MIDHLAITFSTKNNTKNPLKLLFVNLCDKNNWNFDIFTFGLVTFSGSPCMQRCAQKTSRTSRRLVSHKGSISGVFAPPDRVISGCYDDLRPGHVCLKILRCWYPPMGSITLRHNGSKNACRTTSFHIAAAIHAWIIYLVRIWTRRMPHHV